MAKNIVVRNPKAFEAAKRARNIFGSYLRASELLSEQYDTEKRARIREFLLRHAEPTAPDQERLSVTRFADLDRPEIESLKSKYQEIALQTAQRLHSDAAINLAHEAVEAEETEAA